MRKQIVALTGAALLPLGVVGATPAQASEVTFDNCYQTTACAIGVTAGYINWLSRSATLRGNVAHPQTADYSTTVIFEAYYGSKVIESQTRTVSPNQEVKGFGPFSIGGTAGPGGVTRIRVTVCQSYGPQPNCGEPVNIWR